MTLRQYLVLMIAGTTAALISWIAVLLLVDPRSAGGLGMALFIATLFLTLVGITSLVGLFARTALVRGQMLIAHAVSDSFRQAIFISLFLCGVLLMKSRSTLTPWTLILFILALTVLEFFFVAFRRR